MNQQELTKELQKAYQQKEGIISTMHQIDGIILFLTAKLKEAQAKESKVTEENSVI
jgi:hypothetical protein